MIKFVLKMLVAIALLASTTGFAQAQSRPWVTIFNNSTQSLVFNLNSAYSRIGRYRIGPGQSRRFFCNCASTPHFIVQINTAGRGFKRYTLYPGRQYQLKWDSRIGLWNVFTPGAGGGAPARRRPWVMIRNNSNQSLVFNLRSAYSAIGRYRLAPRQSRRFFCNCASTPHFIVRITTTGRGSKRYTLYPSRRYQLQWDPRIGLWNVFASGTGGRPPPVVRPPAGGRRGHFLVRGRCPRAGSSRGSVGFNNIGRNDRGEGAPNFIRISLCSNGRGRRLLLVRRPGACGGRVISRTRFQNVANSDFNEGAPNFVSLVLCELRPMRGRYQISTRGCRQGMRPRSRVRFKNVGNSDFNEGAPNFVTVRLCAG